MLLFLLFFFMDIIFYHPPTEPLATPLIPCHPCNPLSPPVRWCTIPSNFLKISFCSLKKNYVWIFFTHFEILFSNFFTEIPVSAKWFFKIYWGILYPQGEPLYWKYCLNSTYNVSKKNHYNDYSMFRFKRCKTLDHLMVDDF